MTDAKHARDRLPSIALLGGFPMPIKSIAVIADAGMERRMNKSLSALAEQHIVGLRLLRLLTLNVMTAIPVQLMAIG
jgi:hypothetical protein